MFSELVGGMRCAKRNFNSYSVVNVLNGRIAGIGVLFHIELLPRNVKKKLNFRAPGRYYNAYCSMTNTGYIWTQ